MPLSAHERAQLALDAALDMGSEASSTETKVSPTALAFATAILKDALGELPEEEGNKLLAQTKLKKVLMGTRGNKGVKAGDIKVS